MSQTFTEKQQWIIKALEEAPAIGRDNPDKGLELAKQALEGSRALEDSLLIAQSLLEIARLLLVKEDHEQSLDHAKEALAEYEKLEDEKGKAGARKVIGATLYETGKPGEALVFLKACLPIYEEEEDFSALAEVWKLTGAIYDHFGNQGKAIKDYRDAIRAGKKADNPALVSDTYILLSGLLVSRKETDEATSLIEKAIQTKKESGDTAGLAFAYAVRGKLKTALENPEEAKEDLSAAIDLYEKADNRQGVVTALSELGALYARSGQLSEAKETLLKSLQLATDHGVTLSLQNTYYHLYQVMKAGDNLPEALRYLELAHKEKETLAADYRTAISRSYGAIADQQALTYEASLRREKEEINAKKNTELDSFFHRIVHDIKGSLTALIGLNYLAKNDVSDEVALKYFNDYADQAKKMNTVIDDISSLNKMVSRPGEKESIDLEKLVNTCISSYNFLPHFHEVDFRIHIEEDITHVSEWSLLAGIIGNLVENSVKYARTENNDPFVAISIRSTSGKLIIEAEDNGIGMSEDTQSKIFGTFFRINKKIDGTGLGLLIMKRAVDLLDGSIDVRSELDKGSVFTITLPEY